MTVLRACTESRPFAIPRAARLVLRLLEGIEFGTLEVALPDGARLIFGEGAPHAGFAVGNWSAFEQILGRGDIGFAEAFIDGAWETHDLPALLTLLANNRKALGRALHGNWLALLVARLRHRRNANTRDGSRRNIMAHYDLGNAFYGEWLDPTMTYSAALFGDCGERERSLGEAQLAKYRRILRRLDLKPGQHVLEIGCGWGGFAELAIREAGVRVTGVTLSPAQLDYAQARLRHAGLSSDAEFLLCDYRDIRGTYDHIVSIEMFEAVGERYWPEYFRVLRRALRPGGRALVQTITISDALFGSYRRQTDFIQQHVFPGGMLPSPAAFSRAAHQAELSVADAFAFGPDYARTLVEWERRFTTAWPYVAGLGFDERFRRLWLFYLAYCQAGFNTGSTDVYHFELAART